MLIRAFPADWSAPVRGKVGWMMARDSRERRDGDARVALLVCGMHRSGTSALARTFSLLGATLPRHVVPPNEGNPKGHWEPERIVALNDEMLQAAGSDLYSTADFDQRWFATPRAGEFTAAAQAAVAAEYSDDRLIVIKDPRISLLLPIWQQALDALGYTVGHVLPLREPEQVADSLRRRHLKTFCYDAWPPPRGELVWLRYTIAAERFSRGKPRCLVPFGRFFADWKVEADRVAEELDFDWPRRSPDVECEIDDFIDRQADGRQGTAAARSEDKPARLVHSSELASVFYGALVDRAEGRGTDVERLDELAAEHGTRMSKVGDILIALEGVYPLIWTYYEQSRRRDQACVATAQSFDKPESVDRLWRELARVHAEKSALNHEHAFARSQASSLAAALEESQQALAAVDRESARIREMLEATEREHARRVEQSERQMSELLEERAAIRAELDALYASTSWRVTRPMRRVRQLLGD